MNVKKRTLILISLLLPSFLWAQDTPTPQDWSSEFISRIDDTIDEEWEDAGVELSSALFEAITDQTFFSENIIGDLNMKLEVQRKVYDNHDIVNSWTVIDIMQVPFSLPIPILSQDLGLGDGVFGLNLNMNFGGSAYNIRQVVPTEMKSLISTKQLEENLNEAQTLSEEISDAVHNSEDVTDMTINDGEDEEMEEYFSILKSTTGFGFWNKNNPKVYARYSKLWKLLTHPMGVPLTKKSFEKFPIGDIYTYGLNGSVQLGASVGWSGFDIIGADITESSAGLGVSTYIKGNYRVSVLKEDESHAQVKLTRIKNMGRALTIGQAKLEHEIFEGFIIFGEKVLDIEESIIPFSLVFNSSQIEQFDVGYRYDFNDPEAVKAYEKAVLGRFAYSQKLVEAKHPGIKRVFTRNQTSRAFSSSNKVKLSLFFESATSRSRTNTRAVVTIGEEEYHVFSSENVAYEGYDTLWGRSETKKHTFLTSVLLDNPHEFKPEKMTMRIEGKIEDSDTTVTELRSYYKEVEMALNKRDLFPRPPSYYMTISCEELEQIHGQSYVQDQCEEDKDDKDEKSEYGKTYFYYQLDLNYEHLMHIKNASKEEIWTALEYAFGVKSGNWSSSWRRLGSLIINSPLTALNLPLGLFNSNIPLGGRLIVAHRFYRAWKDLQEIEDDKELVEGFGRLFRTLYYSAELMKAVRYLTRNDQITYFFTANADQLWGTRSASGQSLQSPLTILSEADEVINFDATGPRPNGDPTAVVSKLEMKQLDRKSVQIDFTLDKEAEYIFLRVDRSPSWGRYRNLAKIMIKNTGQFKVGLNTIIVDKEDSETYKKRLADAVLNGKWSTFMIAYARANQVFGAVKAKRFKFEYEEEEEEEDKDSNLTLLNLDPNKTGAQ